MAVLESALQNTSRHLQALYRSMRFTYDKRREFIIITSCFIEQGSVVEQARHFRRNKV
jgi:hypothetical protein